MSAEAGATRPALSLSADDFAQLVERHQQALRAFLRRVSGDWALADDLAQETFLTAWSRLGRLAPGQSAGAWLCGIGYNKYLTALRGARRARQRDTDWSRGAADPPTAAPQAEDRLTLQAAMAELSVEQRACVALCLAGDYSHAEAAAALDLPLGTVKSHLVRGRARLLLILGPQS